MATRSTIALLVATVMWCTAGAAFGADHIPAGFVEGREHELRMRPVLGELPPAPKQISRSARRASATAVASCDPAQVDALRKAATTPRDGDDPSTCVVVPDRASADRLLLGQALLTGSDFVTVAERRTSRRRRQLVLRLSPSGQRRWSAVSATGGGVPLAVAVDGHVIERAMVEDDPASSATDPPEVVVLGGRRGMPTARAAQLASVLRDASFEAAIELGRAAQLTSLARRSYARSTPRIYDKDALASVCAEEETIVVFGCFDGASIHILRVDRPDLAGLMPVTAAHEALHALYASSSRAERRRVDALVTAFLDANPDATAHKVLAAYGDIDDELRRDEAHSIVGTVEATLPRALERHYSKYFEDRAEVVAQFEQYQRVFDELEATLTRLEDEAKALETQLSALEGEANAAGSEADRLTDEIDSLRAQGRIDESNDLVDAQNAAVDRANSLVGQYNALVEAYNAKVAELDAASLVGQQLYESLTPIAPA